MAIFDALYVLELFEIREEVGPAGSDFFSYLKEQNCFPLIALSYNEGIYRSERALQRGLGVTYTCGGEMVREKGPLQEPKIVEKPWGREIWYAHTGSYAGKVLHVNAGHRLSLQMHKTKEETLYLLSGKVTLTYNEGKYEWECGQAVHIPPGTIHRFEALEDSVLLEVSTPFLDDVVRIEDDYERS